MSRAKQLHFVNLGPSIPIVPISDFTTIELTHEQWRALWEVCGPTVQKNLQRKAEWWHIICVAYLEGLNHGAGIQAEKGILPQGSPTKAQQQGAAEDPPKAVRAKHDMQVWQADAAPRDLDRFWGANPRPTNPR